MTPKLLILMAKALGFTESLRQLSREERQKYPSAIFGRDYNKLREQVALTFPEIGELLPPAANIVGNPPFTDEKFYELYVFAEQIYQMLDTYAIKSSEDTPSA